MADATFYLGKTIQDSSPVQYDPSDLTTHAVVIGMTGSGKTGLLISILEEAARQRLPAVVIDPKGDLTNLLLHFPKGQPEDFQPWLDPDNARRAGIPLDQMAAQTADRWRAGLAEWGLAGEQIEELARVEYSVYTPGSTAGQPVSLLSSFRAPGLDWGENAEVLREQIASTVTALLGLVGYNEIDPLRSREHILLSNLLENAWKQARSLDLTELIMEVQTPPLERLGAFPLEQVFPAKDRADLAMVLNNFLAAPSFQTWLDGVPLDAGKFLYTPTGDPRFAVFYLAHLDETERMFFVTLLLSAVETWMRAQRGTNSLRALLAFDEITGYLPPVANPSSRPVLLRLLKQARAFGVGLVLATQNPTDLNYKALSNAGSWFIGRLQTERDKERLLDGLQSLENGIDRSAFDRFASQLKPRTFLMHNVHQSAGPGLFNTRWTMNFLAGPLTRAQIKDLPGMHKELTPPAPAQPASTPVPPPPPAPQSVSTPTPSPVSAAAIVTPLLVKASQPAEAAPSLIADLQPAQGDPYTLTRAAVPEGVREFFIPAALSQPKALSASGQTYAGPLEAQGMVYRPALLAQAEVRILARKYNVNYAGHIACLVVAPGKPRWQDNSHAPFDPQTLPGSPPEAARFAPLPADWSAARSLSALQKDFLDWVYRTGGIQIWTNEALKVYAGPEVSEADFRRMGIEAARTGMQPDIDKAAAGFDQKLGALKNKIEKQQAAVSKRQDDLDGRKAEQFGSYVDLASSFFTRRKRSLSAPISKGRQTRQAQDELQDAKQALDQMNQEWTSLQNQRQAALQKISADWQARSGQVTQTPVNPARTDVFTELFGIAWLPCYVFKGRDGLLEVRAV